MTCIFCILSMTICISAMLALARDPDLSFTDRFGNQLSRQGDTRFAVTRESPPSQNYHSSHTRPYHQRELKWAFVLSRFLGSLFTVTRNSELEGIQDVFYNAIPDIKTLIRWAIMRELFSYASLVSLAFVMLGCTVMAYTCLPVVAMVTRQGTNGNQISKNKRGLSIGYLMVAITTLAFILSITMNVESGIRDRAENIDNHAWIYLFESISSDFRFLTLNWSREMLDNILIPLGFMRDAISHCIRKFNSVDEKFEKELAKKYNIVNKMIKCSESLKYFRNVLLSSVKVRHLHNYYKYYKDNYTEHQAAFLNKFTRYKINSVQEAFERILYPKSFDEYFKTYDKIDNPRQLYNSAKKISKKIKLYQNMNYAVKNKYLKDHENCIAYILSVGNSKNLEIYNKITNKKIYFYERLKDIKRAILSSSYCILLIQFIYLRNNLIDIVLLISASIVLTAYFVIYHEGDSTFKRSFESKCTSYTLVCLSYAAQFCSSISIILCGVLCFVSSVSSSYFCDSFSNERAIQKIFDNKINNETVVGKLGFNPKDILGYLPLFSEIAEDEYDINIKTLLRKCRKDEPIYNASMLDQNPKILKKIKGVVLKHCDANLDSQIPRHVVTEISSDLRELRTLLTSQDHYALGTDVIEEITNMNFDLIDFNNLKENEYTMDMANFISGDLKFLKLNGQLSTHFKDAIKDEFINMDSNFTAMKKKGLLQVIGEYPIEENYRDVIFNLYEKNKRRKETTISKIINSTVDHIFSMCTHKLFKCGIIWNVWIVFIEDGICGTTDVIVEFFGISICLAVLMIIMDLLCYQLSLHFYVGIPKKCPLITLDGRNDDTALYNQTKMTLPESSNSLDKLTLRCGMTSQE